MKQKKLYLLHMRLKKIKTWHIVIPIKTPNSTMFTLLKLFNSFRIDSNFILKVKCINWGFHFFKILMLFYETNVGALKFGNIIFMSFFYCNPEWKYISVDDVTIVKLKKNCFCDIKTSR